MHLKPVKTIGLFVFILLGGLSIPGCQWMAMPDETPLPVNTSDYTTETIVASHTPSPVVKARTRTAVVANTPTVKVTVIPEPETNQAALVEPAGCQKPVEDYSVITINGMSLNLRTYLMLQHAAEIYGGEIEITNFAITQGSFHDNGAASFGTHLGGGAVDLSVMRKGTYTILYDEIPTLVNGLRVAGFAAWFRELNELFPGSPAHIHAIAIGDKQLSQAAREQLFGKFGYFRSLSGIPVTSGNPTPDRFGGPILCHWMVEAGYQDLSSKK
jgi:hypothetical protein